MPVQTWPCDPLAPAGRPTRRTARSSPRWFASSHLFPARIVASSLALRSSSHLQCEAARRTSHPRCITAKIDGLRGLRATDPRAAKSVAYSMCAAEIVASSPDFTGTMRQSRVRFRQAPTPPLRTTPRDDRHEKGPDTRRRAKDDEAGLQQQQQGQRTGDTGHREHERGAGRPWHDGASRRVGAGRGSTHSRLPSHISLDQTHHQKRHQDPGCKGDPGRKAPIHLQQADHQRDGEQEQSER